MRSFEGSKRLFLKEHKFQNTLFLLFSVFVGILLIISGVIFYTYSISQMEKTAADNQVNTTVKVQEQISATLSEMDRIAIAVNASEDIVQILEGIPPNFSDNYFDYNPQVNSKVKNILYSVLSLKSFKSRIKLVSQYYDDTGLSTQYDRKITKSEIRASMDYAKMMASDQYKFFIPPHDDVWTAYNSYVISVVRPIRDNYGGVFGFIELNLPISELDEMVRDVNIAILDSNNSVVYMNTDLTDKQRYLIENTVYAEDFGIIDTYDVGLISSHSMMLDVGWRVVQVTDQRVYDYPMKKIGSIILITYSLVFVALLLLLYWFIKGITKPIRKLTSLVHHADADEPNLNLHSKEIQGDIEMLAQSFQELIHTVHNSSKKLIESETREIKMQIKAMEAQLNPHFVFNTLSVIGAYGMKAGNDTVHEMCVDLSSMLRYTIDFDVENATLKSEIEHVIRYLGLMEKRYENKFEYVIENNILNQDIIVPKLIIQPIVENCFLHGFSHMEDPWRVKISLTTDNEKWMIRIEDNGTGFAPEVIDEIKQRLNQDHYIKEKNGIGMTNTFFRLHHYYKGKEYLNFYTNNGAVVEIGGPIDHEKN